MTDSFWEDPSLVRRFANRDPDHRLLKLIAEFHDPPSVRVLDLGCAGGRNTVLLAERGFDVVAVDASAAMVAETRKRVARVVGAAAARRRVRQAPMDDLTRFPGGHFDLVVALGIYHQAHSRKEWNRALAETARVTRTDGTLLVAVFSPRSRPQGTPLMRIAGDPSVYQGFASGPLFLVEPDQLDRELRAHGFEPRETTESVIVATDGGFRVTVNGCYRRLK